MSKSNEQYMKIFRKIIVAALFTDITAAVISLFVSGAPLLFLAGLITGNAGALFKLYYTFRGISKSVGQDAPVRKGIAALMINIFGYLLIAVFLILGAQLGISAFVGVMTGIFNVYFGISVYNVYYGISRRKKRDDDH